MRRSRIIIAALLATAGLLGCAAVDRADHIVLPDAPGIEHFSSARPGDELPGGWRLWTMSRFKKPTDYRLVRAGGRTVVRAQADASASGLVRDVSVDLLQFPILTWRWKVDQLIPGADNTDRNAEDAPVRIVVAFEAGTAKLDFDDRIFATQVRMLTGQELPYATLMYIWENRAPVGTVIPSRHTSRIRMIVADSGTRRLGEWLQETRNVYEDYRNAFGEEPPRIKSIGVMTDTDNTGTKAQAWYGDIAFRRDNGFPGRAEPAE